MRIKNLLVSATMLIAMVGAPATVFAGYAPAGRATFQCVTPTDCPGANYVTFNSFTNAPNYGDERAFFDAKDASITSPGGYQDQMANLHDGQKIEMRVYIHNNANPNTIGVSAATAHNTRMQVILPTASNTSQTAEALVLADNANPGSVSDTVDLSGANPFTLTFDRTSAVNVTYRPNGQGGYVTRALPGATFQNDQTLNANFGDWNGCFNYAALVTFTAIVHMPTVPVTPPPAPPTPPTPPTPPATPKTPATPVAAKATSLPNTGAGEVIGLFTGASAIGTAAHMVVNRRRR